MIVVEEIMFVGRDQVSDIRTRLADALADHNSICDGHTTTECWCGEREPVHGNGIEWAEHVADVLLSLPGIAIVELPPETITPTGWGDDCLGAWPAAPGEDPVSAWPKGKIAMSGGDFISVPDAHALAAALLAAAQAAEKSTTQQ